MTTPRFDEALVDGATAVLALAGAWGALLLLAALVESCSRGRVRALASVGCPVAWRPTLLAALGAVVSLAGVLGPPAHAATRGDGPEPVPSSALPPVPVRPVDGGPDRIGAEPARWPAVTVAPGDSLWSIARERLGERAAPDQVLALTRALHHANRRTVGPDADLIHPGQRLRVPPTPTPREDTQP